jgi:NADPH:quinone reductase-like Zn-dependent oxidoreductase
MKAITFAQFGGSDRYELSDVEDPKVGPDFVLVRVKAAGVNPVDWKVREGKLTGGFYHHFPVIPGWDVAGVVERTGPSVTEFVPGDEVIGYVRRDEIGHGTYAELVSAPVRTLARKPVAASWAQAGGLSLVGLTALQSLRAAGIGGTDTVLVHGASGGVGHLAVQIATQVLGARVIGTCSERNAEFVRSLGAEPVTYGEGLADRVRALAPDGVTAAVDYAGGDALTVSGELVASPSRIVSIINAAAVRELGGRYVFVRPDAADLAQLSAWVDAGRVQVEVQATFALADAAAASDLVQAGHVRGKVVLEV